MPHICHQHTEVPTAATGSQLLPRYWNVGGEGTDFSPFLSRPTQNTSLVNFSAAILMWVLLYLLPLAMGKPGGPCMVFPSLALLRT